ncbi:hypothetical protein GOP47_0004417 [Adiantum capillus-veneris]|uniref:Uncharacterized protein n=1 Tax=Adiantum capillus-veneris TaxID=13818 RepID=A0A9D4ZMT9_ADICA|nr:hypothetical protein GOP47_0004417 [Adiantum capillus-veneris]
MRACARGSEGSRYNKTAFLQEKLERTCGRQYQSTISNLLSRFHFRDRKIDTYLKLLPSNVPHYINNRHQSFLIQMQRTRWGPCWRSFQGRTESALSWEDLAGDAATSSPSHTSFILEARPGGGLSLCLQGRKLAMFIEDGSGFSMMDYAVCYCG